MSTTIQTIRTEAIKFLEGRKQDTRHHRGANIIDITNRTGAGVPGLVRDALDPLVREGMLRAYTEANTGLQAYRLP